MQLYRDCFTETSTPRAISSEGAKIFGIRIGNLRVRETSYWQNHEQFQPLLSLSLFLFRVYGTTVLACSDNCRGHAILFQKKGEGGGRTRYKGWPSLAGPWSYTEINDVHVGTRSWLISHQLERPNYYRLVKLPQRHPRLTALSSQGFTEWIYLKSTCRMETFTGNVV